jgi:hypothetical protein
VESGCCSNRERSKNCDEELLITGVSVSEENQKVLNSGVLASWMNDGRLLENGVSATKEAKQLLDGIVSSMMGSERDDGKGMKRMLNSGVSASGKWMKSC